MSQLQLRPASDDYVDLSLTSDSFDGLLRHKWSLVVPIAAALALACLYIRSASPVYEVTARLLVRPYDRMPTRAEPQFLLTQAEVLRSPALLRGALNAPSVQYKGLSHVDPVAHTRKSLSVEPVANTDVLEVRFQTQEPDQGLRLVRALVDNYQASVYEEALRNFNESDEIRQSEHELRLAEAAAEKLSNTLGAKHPELLAAEAAVRHWDKVLRNKKLECEALAADSVRRIEEPRIQSEIVWPRPLMILAVSSALGLVTGLMLLLYVARVQQRIETPEQVRRHLGLPILGNVPHIRAAGWRRKRIYRGHLTIGAPNSMAAESIRAIRARMQSRLRPEGTVIQFASPAAGEGKTTITSNIACSFALLQKKVIVVDADLRRGTQHEMFGVSAERGLTSVLARGTPLGKAVRRSPVAPVDVLPRGPQITNPGEILAQPAFGTVLQALRNEYDVVLVDSPPLLVIADGGLLAWYADEVLLVLEAGKSTLRDASRAVDFLRSVGRYAGGVVMNKLPSRQLHAACADYYYGAPFDGKLIGRAPEIEAAPSANPLLTHVSQVGHPLRETAAARLSQADLPVQTQQQAAAREQVPESEEVQVPEQEHEVQFTPVVPLGIGDDTTRPSPPLVSAREGTKTWMWHLIRCVSWLNLLLVAVLLVAVRLLSEKWWVTTTVLYMPKLVFLVPSLVLLGPALLWNRRAVSLNLLAAALVLGPLMELHVPLRQVLQPAPPRESDVRVLGIKMGSDERAWDGVLEEIRTRKPDIVAIQTADTAAPVPLQASLKDWNFVSHERSWIATKWPVQLLDACRLETLGQPIAIGAEIEAPEGPIRVYNFTADGVSADEPLTFENLRSGTFARDVRILTNRRRMQAREERAFVSDVVSDLPKVIVGRMNLPSSSTLYREYWGDFVNAFDAAGLGYGNTSRCPFYDSWPWDLPWLRTDHVLLSDHWEVLACRVGGQNGIDQGWIAATIRLRQGPLER